MPKHIHPEHYLSNPYELFPKGNIHPNIEHVPDEAEHYMLPAVFTFDNKGSNKVALQYPGPGVYYIFEGDVEYEDAKNPGEVHKIGAGAVLHIEKDSRIHWFSHNVVKGFAAFWVPVSVKGFDSFVVPDEA